MDNNLQKKGIIDLVKIIPLVGRFLSWILEYLGFKAGLTFLSGVLIVSVLVFVGFWPENLVSKNYTSRPILRIKPKDLKISYQKVPYKEQPYWLHDCFYFLEQEGDREKHLNKIDDYIIAVIDTIRLPATSEFIWTINASPNFLISGRAYRKTTVERLMLYESLEATKVSMPYDSIHFKVSQCEKGDNLLAILRISTKGAKIPEDLARILGSTVE